MLATAIQPVNERALHTENGCDYTYDTHTCSSSLLEALRSVAVALSTMLISIATGLGSTAGWRSDLGVILEHVPICT